MTTNRILVLNAIQAHPGLTDGELRNLTGVEPHQQVNQICRSLAAAGLTCRIPGADGRVINLPVGTEGTARVEGPAWSSVAVPSGPLDTQGESRAVVVVPCSARKADGGLLPAASSGPRIVDLLPDSLAEGLVAARKRLARPAGVDESLVLPAWQRYMGTLYRSAGTLHVAHRKALIISGAYGLLLADEPIGTYDRRFCLADWPGGLLEGCLPAAVRHMEADQVIAFCARTTAYGKLLRSVDWRRHGVAASTVCPQTDGRGGAQVLVPRALGEAVFAYLHAELTSEWHSSDGIPLAVETLA